MRYLMKYHATVEPPSYTHPSHVAPLCQSLARFLVQSHVLNALMVLIIIVTREIALPALSVLMSYVSEGISIDLYRAGQQRQ